MRSIPIAATLAFMTRRLPVPRESGSVPVGVHFVYRAYCQCGDLLYVGVTSNLFNRLSSHHRPGKAEWETKMRRLEWDAYSTREQAERVESRLINTEHPLFNVRGIDRRNRKPLWKWLPELAPPPSLDESARMEHHRLALGDRL